MVITCPRCRTAYSLASERIPEEGARVKCTRCDLVFPVNSKEPEFESADTPVPSVPHDRVSPRLKEQSFPQTPERGRWRN